MTEILRKGNRSYTVWQSMLQRCYSKSYLARKPTYKDCTVSSNFKNFEYFHDWCSRQVGFNTKDHVGISFALDKDILVRGNKQYSEDTCCFVPQEINNLFTGNNMNNVLPRGVYRNVRGKPFRVRIYVDGKRKGLGSFNTVEEAFLVYKQAKEERIMYFANKWKDQIDPKVYTALTTWDVRITD